VFITFLKKFPSSPVELLNQLLSAIWELPTSFLWLSPRFDIWRART